DQSRESPVVWIAAPLTTTIVVVLSIRLNSGPSSGAWSSGLPASSSASASHLVRAVTASPRVWVVDDAQLLRRDLLPARRLVAELVGLGLLLGCRRMRRREQRAQLLDVAAREPRVLLRRLEFRLEVADRVLGDLELHKRQGQPLAELGDRVGVEQDQGEDRRVQPVAEIPDQMLADGGRGPVLVVRRDQREAAPRQVAQQ